MSIHFDSDSLYGIFIIFSLLFVCAKDANTHRHGMHERFLVEFSVSLRCMLEYIYFVCAPNLLCETMFATLCHSTEQEKAGN